MTNHWRSACKTCSKHSWRSNTPLWILTTWNRWSKTTLLAPDTWKIWKHGSCKDHCEHWPLSRFAPCFCKTFAKLSVSGQEGSSSNRSNILRLVKISIRIISEFFRGIWLLTWINLAILSEKCASARCPWRNHDAVLDSLHQTSDFHRCSILKIHCEDMRRYAKIRCKDMQRCAKLIRSVQSFEECQKRLCD